MTERTSTLDEEMSLVLKLGYTQFKAMLDNQGKLHWLHSDNTWLSQRLRAKVAEAGEESGMTWELAADIANYAAMLADKTDRS